MKWNTACLSLVTYLLILSPLGCTNMGSTYSHPYTSGSRATPTPTVPSSIPAQGEKVVIVDPTAHAFGAYNPDGSLVKSGLATCGSDWCNDLGRPCHTRTGTFRVYSLGSEDCISHKFPLHRGGAPMPYCMYFNKGQALHGAPEGEVVYGNISHGCVRLHVEDAEWLRYNFVEGPEADNQYRGTKVIIRSY